MTEVAIRRATPGDLPYLLSTWLNHYKEHSYFALRIKRRIFFERHHQVISNILSRPGTEVLVVHSTEDPEVNFGFLVSEVQADHEHVIHFAFVQKKLRRLGLCRKMMREMQLDWDACLFTHWTYTASDLVRRFPGLTYDPYRA